MTQQWYTDVSGVQVDHPTWEHAAEHLASAWRDAPDRASLAGVLAERKPGTDVTLAGANRATYAIRLNPNHTGRQHSRLGASVAERFWNCPASIRRGEGMPDRETEAARKGTAAHEVAHMCLVGGQDAIEYVGRVVNGVPVDDKMADAVQVYLDDCRATPGTEPPLYEVQFDLAELNPPEPMFGTADFVRYDASTSTLHVKDYKNGWILVSAVGNKQLRYYALGAMLALGPRYPVSQIEVTICQPNGLGPDLKRDTFDAIDLHDWSVELMQRARATQAPDAPAAPGAWCTFCPVRAHCTDRMERHFADAGVEFDTLPAVPEVRLLTPADLGRIHTAAPLLRAFLDSVAKAIAVDPAGTGWKVVEKESRTQVWRDEADAAQALELFHEVDPWQPRAVVSPAQARARIAERLRPDHKTKKAAEDAARAVLADLVFKPKSAALVPEADPRPAIVSNGAEFDTEGTAGNE